MSEAAIAWGVSAVLASAIVFAYALQFRLRARRNYELKVEATRLGIDKQAAQYPFVDPTRCIGCGVCVQVCPEGEVLAVVAGTATVVNGFKCLGHGECGRHCPVGAIEVGLGDVRSRSDIPVMDEWHETSLPGLFIAGELGGLALIRNAVAQGERVVQRIAERATAGHGQGRAVDVLVVGSGPAGMAAAASAVRRGLSHVVLEKEKELGGSILHYPRRHLVLVQPLEFPLGGRLEKDEYSKEKILEFFEGIVRRLRLQIRYDEALLDVRKEDGLFVTSSTKGNYRSRFVVLALGRRGSPRKLGVPGEDLPKVMYKLLDAESYRGQRILVVGGGDSAVEAAYGLAQQPSNRITLSYRGEKFVRIKRRNEDHIGKAISKGTVDTLFGSQVTEILPDRVRLRVAEKNIEIGNDHVFVFAGGDPPLPLLQKIGIRFGGESSTQRPLAGETQGASRPTSGAVRSAARAWGDRPMNGAFSQR